MTDAPLTVGCLFDGIHGFGLGLAAAAPFRCSWTVENADYPRALLGLRVPHAEHLADVRDVDHPPRVDWLTGGFPCQDLSYAGLGAGIAGSRSGLWSEYARIIGEIEPDVVLIENVPALLSRGMDLVVENLVELGYRVEWDCLPAAAFGAPHLRDRVWIVAHRGPSPRVFGDPAALMARDVGARQGDWRKWPRAGWVDGKPDEVLELVPLARVGDVKRGAKAAQLLPTPTAINPNETEPLEKWEARRERERARGINGNGFGMPLGIYARKFPTQLPEAVRDAALLPTPNAADGDRGSECLRRSERDEDGRPLNPTLLGAARYLPTPQAADGSGGRIDDYARAGRDGSGGGDLATAVARLPTPRATDGDARNRDDLLPTPTANRRTGLQSHGRNVVSGALNPAWVEWIMGFPLGWTDATVANDELIAAPWELGEPEGIPRLTLGTAHRKERLTALGNALVPAAPAWIAARYLRG